MSERKAINKYYPPDYDPSKVVKKKKNPNQTIKIRMMAPYSMRCLRCNEYIAERRSFNARKEVTSERYLNIKIVRFYITCPGCNNTITFKTNPAEAGYTPEDGAVRNFEPSKKQKRKHESEDELLQRLQNEEEKDKKYQLLMKKRKTNPFWKEQDASGGDVMEKFEKRLVEQQRQQELTAELEAIQKQVDNSKSKSGDEVLSNLLERKEDDARTDETDGSESEENNEAGLEKIDDAARAQKSETTTEQKGEKTPDRRAKSNPTPLKIPSKIIVRKKPNAIPNLDYSSDSD